jgi:hypothetical protein
MEALKQNLTQDTFYHLDNLKFNLTKLKLAHDRNRTIVDHIDDLLTDCELIQLIIQSYDNHNFRHVCNVINNYFLDPNIQGVSIVFIKKRYELNIDHGKLVLIKHIV